MIDVISNWAGELVVSLISVTLIEMLLPENKIKKYVKTVIGVYIIFCIISPFIDKEEFLAIFENAEKNMERIQIESKVSSALEDPNSSIEALYIQEFEKDVINSIYLKIGNKKIKNEQNVQIENVQKVEISINTQEEGNNKSGEENEETKKVKEFLITHYEISSEKVKVTQN